MIVRIKTLFNWQRSSVIGLCITLALYEELG